MVVWRWSVMPPAESLLGRSKLLIFTPPLKPALPSSTTFDEPSAAIRRFAETQLTSFEITIPCTVIPRASTARFAPVIVQVNEASLSRAAVKSVKCETSATLNAASRFRLASTSSTSSTCTKKDHSVFAEPQNSSTHRRHRNLTKRSSVPGGGEALRETDFGGKRSRIRDRPHEARGKSFAFGGRRNSKGASKQSLHVSEGLVMRTWVTESNAASTSF